MFAIRQCPFIQWTFLFIQWTNRHLNVQWTDDHSCDFPLLYVHTKIVTIQCSNNQHRLTQSAQFPDHNQHFDKYLGHNETKLSANNTSIPDVPVIITNCSPCAIVVDLHSSGPPTSQTAKIVHRIKVISTNHQGFSYNWNWSFINYSHLQYFHIGQ